MKYDDMIIQIQLKMELKSISPAISVESIATDFSATSRKVVSAKLPKFQLQQFDGKPQNWFEFWDSFCCREQVGKLRRQQNNSRKSLS